MLLSLYAILFMYIVKKLLQQDYIERVFRFCYMLGQCGPKLNFTAVGKPLIFLLGKASGDREVLSLYNFTSSLFFQEEEKEIPEEKYLRNDCLHPCSARHLLVPPLVGKKVMAVTRVTAVTRNALKVTLLKYTSYFFQKICNRLLHFKVFLLTGKVRAPR